MFSRAYWAKLRKVFTCAEFFFLSNVVWSYLDNIAQCFYLLTNNFYEEDNLYNVILSLFTACGATMSRGRHWLEHKCKKFQRKWKNLSLLLWKWFLYKVLWKTKISLIDIAMSVRIVSKYPLFDGYILTVS